MCDDIYSRYIQFRTLHRRFHANNILFKMKKKETPMCDICEDREYSIDDMLIYCEVVQKLWREVEEWILEISVIDYSIDEYIIIVGEIKRSYWLDMIILITKKNFNAKIGRNIHTFKRNLLLMFN